MVAEAGNSADSAQIPAGEFLVFRPLHRKEATGPRPVAISRSHTEPAEACEELSRRPSAILSRFQTFEQSLLYSLFMKCRAGEPGNKITSAYWENYRPKSVGWRLYHIWSLQSNTVTFISPLTPQIRTKAPKPVTKHSYSAQLPIPCTNQPITYKTKRPQADLAASRNQRNPQIAQKNFSNP